MTEAVVAGFQARIRAAVAAHAPLRIRGGGTKDFYGQALAGDVLDTTECEGIVDYDPTELVITVRAGTRLAHVEQILPEICTLDCGSMNFAAGGDYVMVNTPDILRAMARRVRQLGIRPEQIGRAHV